MKIIEKIKGKLMPVKKQKKGSKNEPKQYPRWLKVLHVICYILSLIFIIVILYSCCNPIKNDNNNKVVPNNMYEIKESKPLLKTSSGSDYAVDDLTNTSWTIDINTTITSNVSIGNSTSVTLNGSIRFYTIDEERIVKNISYIYISSTYSRLFIHIQFSDQYRLYYASNGGELWQFYDSDDELIGSLSSNELINITITGGDTTNDYMLYLFNTNFTYVNGGSGGDSSESPSSSEVPSSEIPSSETISTEIISSEDESIVIPPFISIDDSNLIQPLDAVIYSNPRFVELYSNTVGSERVPNLYYNRNLSDYYQDYYYLEGMTFKIKDEDDIYNTIIVKFGRLSADMFGTNPDTYRTLCFLTEGTIYDSNYSDFTSFQGCTANVGLLGIDTSQYSNYYYVDKVYYSNVPSTTDLTQLKLVYDGVRTTSQTLYVASNDTLVSSGNTVSNAMYFVRNGWLNQNYRKIQVISQTGDLLETPNSNLNSMDLLTFLTSSSNGSSITTADINNVFSLLSIAFSSFVGLFSISLLPNLTLGILLFIPLVVIITLTIIRLIKRG